MDLQRSPSVPELPRYGFDTPCEKSMGLRCRDTCIGVKMLGVT